MVIMNSRRAHKELRALTLVELLVIIVCIAILGFIVMSGVPTARDRSKAMQAACESNLKQIGIAFRTWEGDYGNKYPMSVPKDKGGSMEYGASSETFMHLRVMSNELYNPKVLICPADNRKPAADFADLKNNNLSYFVGLDADESHPAMLLAGDRNLMTNKVDVVPGLVVIRTNDAVGWTTQIHNLTGNFGVADGSVQKGLSGTFQMFLSRTGTNMTRLAVP